MYVFKRNITIIWLHSWHVLHSNCRRLSLFHNYKFSKNRRIEQYDSLVYKKLVFFLITPWTLYLVYKNTRKTTYLYLQSFLNNVSIEAGDYNTCIRESVFRRYLSTVRRLMIVVGVGVGVGVGVVRRGGLDLKRRRRDRHAELQTQSWEFNIISSLQHSIST